MNKYFYFLFFLIACKSHVTLPTIENMTPSPMTSEQAEIDLENVAPSGYRLKLDDSTYYIYFFDQYELDGKFIERNLTIEFFQECDVFDTVRLYNIIDSQGWRVLETFRCYKDSTDASRVTWLDLDIESDDSCRFYGGIAPKRHSKKWQIWFKWVFLEKE